MSPIDSSPSMVGSNGRGFNSNDEFPENIAPHSSDPSMESLGEALAGVNLTSSTKTSSFGSSAINTSTFALGNRDNDGWGNYSTPNTSRISEEAALSESHVRHESLELFLSQSPSQTLGDEVFRFSHSNLPSLDEERRSNDDAVFRLPVGKPIAPNSGSQLGYGEIRSHEHSRRRVESPSCSVTGTTTSSRSVSPYASTNGGMIPSFQRFETPDNNRNKLTTFGEDPNASSMYNGVSVNNHNSNIQTTNGRADNAGRSPYLAKDYNARNGGTSYEQPIYDRSPNYNGHGQHFNHSPQMQSTVGQQAQMQQQQVLYMAVPSPDGHGQVLQPVQMMQMPGKPYAYVIPGGNNFQGLSSPGIDNGHGHMGMTSTLNPSVSDNGNHGMNSGISRNNGRRYAPHESNNTSLQYGGDSSYGLSSPNPRAGLGMLQDYKDSSLDQDLSINPYTSDPAIASLYAAPQRPPLEALLGQVRRLSRDQVGCRLVQQALDEEGPLAATLILNEGLPFWGEAMVDPFGNYLFQKIIEKISAEERVMLIESVSSRLVNASLNLHGTRSVQKVVELCAQDEVSGFNGSDGKESASMVLTKSLVPAAARLCIDSHGNHVIQRILLRLLPVHSHFVFDAVAASVGDVARHRHGCCVIQRCLDSPPSPARAHLVRRIVEKSLELMQDAYGNYVVQYVLDVCSDDDVQAVCESVIGKVNLLAVQKFSSNVMEKCLERCSDRIKEAYLREMSDPERIRELMMDPFGNYVVQRALSVATQSQAIRLVEAMRPHLSASQTTGSAGQRNGGVRNTAGGRRIIAKICRRFPNFTLSQVGSQDELYTQNRSNHRYINHGQHGHAINSMHRQSPMAPAYHPVGVPLMPAQYGGDPRMIQSQMPIQQHQQAHPSSYGNGISEITSYYDQFATEGFGGYIGM